MLVHYDVNTATKVYVFKVLIFPLTEHDTFSQLNSSLTIQSNTKIQLHLNWLNLDLGFSFLFPQSKLDIIQANIKVCFMAQVKLQRYAARYVFNKSK